METKTDISTNKNLGQLKAIFYLLQTQLEQFTEDVDESYALLKVGERTKLSKKIEETLENPIGSVFEVYSTIDEQVKHIVDVFVRSFLQKNKKLISKAIKSQTATNSLHYSISLKEDNIDNRNKIFDFFDKYDLLEISENYPVSFQFTPIELLEKIRVSEEIAVNG